MDVSHQLLTVDVPKNVMLTVMYVSNAQLDRDKTITPEDAHQPQLVLLTTSTTTML